MHKETLLASCQKSKGTSSLLGGDLLSTVINSKEYISIQAQIKEDDTDDSASLDHVILSSLLSEGSDKIKPVIMVGPAGSGKTTALKKLIMHWAKDEQLQSFSNVFYFQFRELNHLDGMISLERLLLQHYSHFSPESISAALQKPETLLFIFDGLDQYKHSLDPSNQMLCSDLYQSVSVPALVVSLFRGSLLKGAVFLLATRPTGCMSFLDGNQVNLLGFLKPQRKAYFHHFFTDPEVSDRALQNMERTLGSYSFCTNPLFCWTVCCIYKALMDTGEMLPQTLTQLCVSITVHLIKELSLGQTRSRDLVTALGRMAHHCCLSKHSKCTKEELACFGLQQFLSSPTEVNGFLEVDGVLESDECMFSFHTKLIQEFMLAISFYLDTSVSDSIEEMRRKFERNAEFLDLFLAGLSEPIQRKPVEELLGAFDSGRVVDFNGWIKGYCLKTLENYGPEKHLYCFRLLHQCQNESLVRESITSSARIGISYGGLSLQDCIALNYVVVCLGEIEQLNLYNAKDLTPDKGEILTPALRLSQKIILSQSSVSAGCIHHLASAISKGRTKELDLSRTYLGDTGIKSLCAGLRDCKLNTLKVPGCQLTEACCGDLASALTSSTCGLLFLDLNFNDILDEGLMQLCVALQNPNCKLQELHLDSCTLTEKSMEALSMALCFGQSQLRVLNLWRNAVGDKGTEQLSKALKHPCCKLQSLLLFDCELTGGCCAGLAEALQSENCSLTELDLSVNELGQDGTLKLCEALNKPGCPLEKLSLVRCELTPPVFEKLGLLLNSGSPQLRSLSVGLNNVGDQGVKHLWDALMNPCCQLEDLDVEMTELTDACVEDLCAAVRASTSLRNLELKNNSLTDQSVPALVKVMQDSRTMKEMNLQYNDFSEDVFDIMDQCGKIRY